MKSYLITAPIKAANGYQQFTVDAKNEADALRKFKNGECELVGEELEVTDIGEPQIELNK